MRAKATEEMLRNLPSKKIDWSAFSFENRGSPSSILAENVDANVGVKADNSTKPIDASLQTAAGRSDSHRFQGTILYWFELNLSSCFRFLLLIHLQIADA